MSWHSITATDYVTGASGFIGKHLMKKITATAIPHDKPRMYNYSDIRNLYFLSTYGNMSSHDDHYSMVRANVMDLLQFIGWPPQWLCFMSSSSVTLPVQTPYARTKRAAEEILQVLPELRSCIVRPYSVTGVGEQKEHLIPTLIRSCMEGEPMTFNPYPVHDFVDVEDVVDGLVDLADKEFTGIIEFGNGRPVTNQEVREIVETTCGKKANAKSVNEQMRPYDNSSWYCRTRHEFWKPKKSLEQSIQEMVEEHKRTH